MTAVSGVGVRARVPTATVHVGVDHCFLLVMRKLDLAAGVLGGSEPSTHVLVPPSSGKASGLGPLRKVVHEASEGCFLHYSSPAYLSGG